jgi:DNA modification methylase
MATSQTRLRTSPIAALVNRVVPLTFTVEFSKRYTNRVCDPFCGHGTVLHVAEEIGMDSVGVDIDPKVCDVARQFVSGIRQARRATSS